MAYCTPTDLLLGQLESRLPPEVNMTEYIAIVADEMDARLGFMYEVPFQVAGINALPAHQVKLLKSINAKRASGRVIMAATIASEDSLVHQYALRLMQEADIELAAIANSDVRLSAPLIGTDGLPIEATEDPELDDPQARIPGAVSRDVYSATLAFESSVYQGESVVWAPNDGARPDSALPYPRGH
jgi:predicted regulator of Ras-like GTPase activity (Roadblock/LC7/MglB family)